MATSMIPKAEIYLEMGMNVLLFGLHGVGKTEAVVSLAREQNVVLKYYSCSTLDPFTDLVGVPTPRKFCTKDRVWLGTDKDACPICSHKLEEEDSPVVESLKMVRPRDIDEAELIFFDEFNRGDEKTQNAIFEIIQFGTINGERIKGLRACWAAMNPPDGDYKVSDLDPALIDRFDVFIDVQAKPTVAYMSQYIDKPIAQAIYSWWGEHNNARKGVENFISPRRLMKIGLVHQKTGDFRPALPKWIDCDRNKLGQLIERAENDMKKVANTTSGKLGDGPNPQFQYNEDWLAEKRVTVAKYMKDNQDDLDTHKEILKVIGGKHGKTTVEGFAEVLDALKPSLLEGYVSGLNPGKLTTITDAVSKLADHRYQSVPNLRKELGLA